MKTTLGFFESLLLRGIWFVAADVNAVKLAVKQRIIDCVFHMLACRTAISIGIGEGREVLSTTSKNPGRERRTLEGSFGPSRYFVMK